MFNADMVNSESECLELPDFCEKLPGKSVFLAFKTTVNYKRGSRANRKIASPVRNFAVYISHIRQARRSRPISS